MRDGAGDMVAAVCTQAVAFQRPGCAPSGSVQTLYLSDAAKESGQPGPSMCE